MLAQPVRALLHVHRRQQGIVLVMALIFLLLLTILAISASGRSLLQERMVGGLRNNQQAQMGAEAALRGGEWLLWSLPARGLHLDCPGAQLTACYVFNADSPNPDVVRFRSDAGWPAANDSWAGAEYQGDANGFSYMAPMNGSTLSAAQQKLAALTNNPRFIIERLGQETPPGVGSQIEGGVTAAYGSSSAPSTSLWLWRVTARAQGGNPNTVRVLESTYAAPANN